MNKCMTCQNWQLVPGCSNKPMCSVLERELIGRSDYRWELKIPVLQPPADFGCIYHKAQPELVERLCQSCRYWESLLTPRYTWARCKLRTTEYEILQTRHYHTCDKWRANP